MTQFPRIPILVPLLVGATAVLCSILIQALALRATISLLRREAKLGRMGTSFRTDSVIVTATLAFALLAHLIQIGFWAELFVICGEFTQFGVAYYHSATNFTTLGYGDLVMAPSWRLLGPLEAANGMLMFGVSTAVVFAVIQRLTQTRFADLRG
jgi:Ion channel